MSLDEQVMYWERRGTEIRAKKARISARRKAS